MTNANLLVPAAQYLRMSTEHQQYSLENQSAAIQKYADSHGLEVVLTYPGWTKAKLTALATSKSRVRVSGWILMDPEHPDQVGKTRATLWEIHPIVKIEVFSGGKWREL